MLEGYDRNDESERFTDWIAEVERNNCTWPVSIQSDGRQD
jgi:hypothetical protein